jgi:tripartite-type tricarboxylate transporter receptor subunit TctC
MKERITGFGADVIANTPEQMDAFLRADRERWAKVIKDGGLKIEQ